MVCWLTHLKGHCAPVVWPWGGRAGWYLGEVFGDRIKILALVPSREKCQPVYFVSRAQTAIRIQSDIINTRKGQGWAGHGIEHTQPGAGVGT